MAKVDFSLVCKTLTGQAGKVPVENAIPIMGEHGQMVVPSRDMVIGDIILSTLNNTRNILPEEISKYKTLVEKTQNSGIVDLDAWEFEKVDSIIKRQVLPVVLSYQDNVEKLNKK